MTRPSKVPAEVTSWLELGPKTAKELIQATGRSTRIIYLVLHAMEKEGIVQRDGMVWSLTSPEAVVATITTKESSLTEIPLEGLPFA